MNYNERKLKQAEAILFLANEGFLNCVSNLAIALTACTTKDEAKQLSEDLIAAVEAIESIEADIRYYKEKCEEERI